MQQCMTELDAAKAQFLLQHALVSELQEVVSVLQAEHHNKDQDNTQQARLHGQHDVDAPAASVVASAAKHLQAATLVQQLQLPEVRNQQQNPFSTLQDTTDSNNSAGPHPQLLGTKQHLLGVTPQQLRQLYLPSRKAAQRNHAPLLPLLEKRLKQKAQAAAAPITASSSGDQDAVQTVQRVRASMAQLQQSNKQQLQQLHNEAAAYVQELEAIHEVLQQLVGQCMVAEQPKIAQAQRDQMEAYIESFVNKLQHMHLHLHTEMYDSSNVQALTAIRQEQQNIEQELQEAIEQAESMLHEYTQLGPAFDDVVQNYVDTKGRIQEVDRVLRTLTTVEEEWVGEKQQGAGMYY